MVDRMTRDGAIARATDYFDSGGYFDDLAHRVAIHTESQEPYRAFLGFRRTGHTGPRRLKS